LDNQPLFLNKPVDGKSFNVVYDTSDQSRSFTWRDRLYRPGEIIDHSRANFTQYSSLRLNAKAYGLLPLWKLPAPLNGKY
jgi:hypothetical protein